MRCRCAYLLLAVAIPAVPIAIRSDAAEPAESTELMQIYEADQKDREASVGPGGLENRRASSPAGSACEN